MEYFIVFISFLLIACDRKTEDKKLQPDAGMVKTDTLIGQIPITNEIAGSAYRKRAMAYFLIIKGDTSDFRCILMESKEGGLVDMEIRFKRHMSYRQQLRELQKIIPAGVPDFAYDSLRSIFISRLVTTGDLAVDISRQLQGDKFSINDYSEIKQFLLKTKLAADFNRLLLPVNRSVAGFSVEKVFLADKKVLFSNATVETDSSEIPDRILDCITWIRINR
jgi:hypothetical protein